MAEVHMVEHDRKLKILHVKEKRHKSSSGKAYNWQRVYMEIKIKHAVITRVGIQLDLVLPLYKSRYRFTFSSHA